jgi:hypothetical protein
MPGNIACERTLCAGDRLNWTVGSGGEGSLAKDMFVLRSNYHKYDPLLFIYHISFAIIFNVHI